MRPLLDTPFSSPEGAARSAPITGAVRCVIALGNALGEGVLWSVREQAVYWAAPSGEEKGVSSKGRMRVSVLFLYRPAARHLTNGILSTPIDA